MTAFAYVGLGSNLGDRAGFLLQALDRLAATEGINQVRRSAIYETQPVGGPPGQQPYLNAVAELVTTLTPGTLLERLLAIEKEMGRVRQVKDGPRTLDLDLLFYGNLVINEEQLTLPHPRLHERLFVLDPLVELAPGLHHPVRNRTIHQIRAELTGVVPTGPAPGRELVGQRALITGSTSGIGRAIALQLARAGADVVIHGRRSRESAEQVARAVRLAGSRAEILMADLRDPAACEQLARSALEVWSGLEILVNNAGADILTGAVARWDYFQKLDELLATDVKATMRMCRIIGAAMKEKGDGVIINMGWDQAETGMEGDPGELFATVKGAIMCFTRSLALSLAPQVRVHCVAPGWIRTSWGEGASTIRQERVKNETPLQVWGKPEDIAATVSWLVSPGARYLDGQVLRVNGGAVR